jgi:hypothetical protein
MIRFCWEIGAKSGCHAQLHGGKIMNRESRSKNVLIGGEKSVSCLQRTRVLGGGNMVVKSGLPPLRGIVVLNTSVLDLTTAANWNARL